MIREKHHTHLQATKWKTLPNFASYLSDCCIENRTNKLGIKWRIKGLDGDEIFLMLIDQRREREE